MSAMLQFSHFQKYQETSFVKLSNLSPRILFWQCNWKTLDFKANLCQDKVHSIRVFVAIRLASLLVQSNSLKTLQNLSQRRVQDPVKYLIWSCLQK